MTTMYELSQQIATAGEDGADISAILRRLRTLIIDDTPPQIDSEELAAELMASIYAGRTVTGAEHV